MPWAARQGAQWAIRLDSIHPSPLQPRDPVISRGPPAHLFPLAYRQAKVRKELRAWIRRLHEEIRVTSVCVTHDQDEALEVADRVVITNRGRIEQIGTPDEVFHHPATEFVMNFLGDVNAFHGRVHAGTVQFGTLELPFPHSRQQIAGDARVFVRPYDVTIDTEARDPPSLEAHITRVHSAGPVVRVEF